MNNFRLYQWNMIQTNIRDTSPFLYLHTFNFKLILYYEIRWTTRLTGINIVVNTGVLMMCAGVGRAFEDKRR